MADVTSAVLLFFGESEWVATNADHEGTCTDLLKISIDTAYIREPKAGAWGFIIRDHNGDAMLVGAGRMESIYGALLAATYACRAGWRSQRRQNHGICISHVQRWFQQNCMK